MKLSILEQQLAKEAALKEIEDAAILAIEAEIEFKAQKKVSNRSQHRKEMRRQQAKRAYARKKATVEKFNRDNNIPKETKYRAARSSVLIKKPIEAVDRFKRIV